MIRSVFNGEAISCIQKSVAVIVELEKIRAKELITNLG
jgi:hypothetical protein